MQLRTQSRRKAGFTLIELVVVVAILVVLSGFLLPKLDTFKLKANKGVSAAAMGGITQVVESYRIQHDLFPDNWDSLLDSTNNTTLHAQLNPQLTGSQAGNPTKLATTTIATDSELRSLVRVGVTSVLDHVTLPEYPSDGATMQRALAVGDTVATINAADGDGLAILAQFYPATAGAVPAGKKVVVFGLGERSNMVGNSIYNAPFYPNADQITTYARYLCCFELDTGGGRARYLGTLGADGDMLKEEIKDYYTL